jgi:HisJ family histidinol phosphate phosphatase
MVSGRAWKEQNILDRMKDVNLSLEFLEEGRRLKEYILMGTAGAFPGGVLFGPLGAVAGIVSVHFLKDGKTMVPLDWKEEGFLDAVKHFGNVKKLVKWYYSSLRSAIKTGCFDVVSHFDLIKIWNKDHKYFTGGERGYRREVDRTLRLMAEKNVKIDLNASGLRKPCAEQYPSFEIIKKAKVLGIKFLVGTDAHDGKQLDGGLKEINEILGI